MNITYAKHLARSLMDEHGLQHWTLRIGKSKRAAGWCWNARQIIDIGGAHIRLNDEPEVRDTILHEIAHALAGHAAAHGPLWKRICVAIGAKPERCTGKDVVSPPWKYVAGCQCVGKKHGLDRLSQRKQYFCRRCESPLTFSRADFESCGSKAQE